MVIVVQNLTFRFIIVSFNLFDFNNNAFLTGGCDRVYRTMKCGFIDQQAKLELLSSLHHSTYNNTHRNHESI